MSFAKKRHFRIPGTTDSLAGSIDTETESVSVSPRQNFCLGNNLANRIGVEYEIRSLMWPQHFGQQWIHDDVHRDLGGIDLKAVVLADLRRGEEDEGVLTIRIVQRLPGTRSPHSETPVCIPHGKIAHKNKHANTKDL